MSVCGHARSATWNEEDGPSGSSTSPFR